MIRHWSSAADFINYGRPIGSLANIGHSIIDLILLKHWLKGVYMCQEDTCEIISQSDYPFKSYGKKIQMLRICLSLDEAHQVSCENRSRLLTRNPFG